MRVLSLAELADAIARSVKAVDENRPCENVKYRPGVGPLREATVVRLCFDFLANSDDRFANSEPKAYEGTRSVCDIVTPQQWALELKLARPFGDNQKPAEHWIENVLYPYTGNQSIIGDCYKLSGSEFKERLAVGILAYEHQLAKINVDTAVSCFEQIARNVLNFRLSPLEKRVVNGLVHPGHQVAKLYLWELYR